MTWDNDYPRKSHFFFPKKKTLIISVWTMNATPFLNFLDESKSGTRTLSIGATYFFNYNLSL